MASFKKVKFEMCRGNGYGQYLIVGTYHGKKVTVHSTDSEAWDYLNDSNKVKQLEARKYCYYRILEAFNNL